MSSNATILENKIKDKLGIRWIDARKFAQDAQKTLNIGDDELENYEAEMLLEALKAFVSLPKEEQESMRQKKVEASEEPQWKRKAREQAERREREWEAKVAAEKNAEQQSAIESQEEIVPANNEPTITKVTQGPQQEVKGPKKIIRVTKTVTDNNGNTKISETIDHEPLDGPGIKITRTQVCCVIL